MKSIEKRRKNHPDENAAIQDVLSRAIREAKEGDELMNDLEKRVSQT